MTTDVKYLKRLVYLKVFSILLNSIFFEAPQLPFCQAIPFTFLIEKYE